MLFGGVVFVLAYFVFLCCRAGLDCCRKEAGCGPNTSRLILFIFAALMLVMMACSFVGYTNFMEGVDGVADNSGKLKKIINRLKDSSGDLSSQGVRFVTQTEKADCSPDILSKALTNSATVFDTYADMYSSVLPDAKSLSMIQNIFAEKVPDYVKYFLGFAFALTAVAFLLTLFGLCCKSAALLNLASLVGIITLLLLILTVAFELTMSVMFADFCYYGPNQAVYEMAWNYKERTAGVVRYYTICDGTNPLDIALNKTIIALGNIKNATRNSALSCQDTVAENAIKSISAEATITTPNLTSTQECERINGIYYDMVDNVLCDKTVQGLWQLWATHMAAAAIIYINLFFTSFVKQKCKVRGLALILLCSLRSDLLSRAIFSHVTSATLLHLGFEIDGRRGCREGYSIGPSSRPRNRISVSGEHTPPPLLSKEEGRAKWHGEVASKILPAVNHQTEAALQISRNAWSSVLDGAFLFACFLF